VKTGKKKQPLFTASLIESPEVAGPGQALVDCTENFCGKLRSSFRQGSFGQRSGGGVGNVIEARDGPWSTESFPAREVRRSSRANWVAKILLSSNSTVPLFTKGKRSRYKSDFGLAAGWLSFLKTLSGRYSVWSAP